MEKMIAENPIRIEGRNLEALIARAKRWTGNSNALDSDENVPSELSRRLIASDAELLHALQADSEATASVIRILSETGHQKAILSLFSNLEIPRDDTGLL